MTIFKSENSVVGMIGVLLILVTVLGFFAYEKFTGIVNEFSKELNPDYRMVLAESLLNDLNTAENSVKSFSLTKDTNYLEKFSIAAVNTQEKCRILHQLKLENSNFSLAIDSLEMLIQQKFNLLNELLLLQDPYRAQQALEKLVNEIEKISNKTANSIKQPVQEDEKKGIFKIFRSKKKDKSSTTAQTSENSVSLQTLNREVKEVKSEEKNFEIAQKNRELNLITQDKNVNSKINRLLDDLKRSELLRIKEKSIHAETEIRKANENIIWFCVVFGIILIMLTYIIFRYHQHNAAHRTALNSAKKQAETLAMAKEKFLNTMSHEIRTPMNAISGFTNLIAQGDLSKTQRDQIKIVQKSNEHLLHIVNEILDFSKLKAYKLKLEKVPFLIQNELLAIAELFSYQADEKGLNLDLESAIPTDCVLIGDPNRLRQIVTNLTQNAIKFTPSGTIAITAKLLPDKKSNTWLELSVSDTGIGIGSEQLETIFDEFEQAEEGTSRKFGGTGLGLSISRLLIELHGGEISATSTLEKGSVFTIKIPFTIGSIDLIPIEEETIDEWSLQQQRTIIITDDVLFNRQLLQSMLQKHGFATICCENGEQCVNTLKDKKVDLILMDIRMPVMNGIEACTLIRKFNPIIPIIALTATTSNEEINEIHNCGMSDYLSKPFKEKDLISRISKHLEMVFLESTNSKNNTKNQLIDFSSMEEMAINDKSFYKEMLKSLLDELQTGINQLLEADKNKNFDLVADLAHKLRGPTHHLNIFSLLEPFRKIETIIRSEQDINLIEEQLGLVKDVTPNVLKEIKQELNK